MDEKAIAKASEVLSRLASREEKLLTVRDELLAAEQGRGCDVSVTVKLAGLSSFQLHSSRGQPHPFLSAVLREINQQINQIDSRRRDQRWVILEALNKSNGGAS